jgi:ribosomal protein L11 methyltransferase
MIRLAFRAPAEQAEIVLAALVELAPAGVEEVDGVVVQVSGREVPDDWAERWKRFHRPVLIAGKIYVRPPWEEPAVRPGVTEIVIDPGQAFGTGTHPTTALCLELMLDLKPDRSFADLGCGSGVLAIAAAKLGFEPVTAVDAERESVRATQMNANVNGVRIDRIERGDLRNAPAPKADVVAANLMRPLLLRVAELWQGRPPATLIVSGLLDHEADEVAAAFAPLTERKRLSSLGWSALLLS